MDCNLLLPDGVEWDAHHGDCIKHHGEMPAESVDFLVCSVPFSSMYAYTSEACDIGNSEDLDTEAKLHFGFFFRSLRRVMKPGRVVAIHCMQIPLQKRSGKEGVYDFRGLLIRLGKRAGFIYDYDWGIRRNPQAQAIRTKSRSLQFVGLESDRAKSRGALLDYVIKFIAPGDNAVPIDSEGEVSRNDWIEWAEGCWTGINETETLNVREARGEDDTKHLCALQLGVIRRLVKLYSNPGEIVYSPFAGIGSELYTALKLDRRAYGCEIKPEYIAVLRENCAKAVASRCEQGVLWGAEA